MNSVELHIDELILDGFAPGDHDLIGGVVERELARLLAEHGLPRSLQQNSELARLDGGTFEVPREAPGVAIGTEAAQAVYRGLR